MGGSLAARTEDAVESADEDKGIAEGDVDEGGIGMQGKERVI